MYGRVHYKSQQELYNQNQQESQLQLNYYNWCIQIFRYLSQLKIQMSTLIKQQMKAFLLVCLIATSLMVNAVETPQEKTFSVESDSPSFLHVKQVCPSCCYGVCCQNQSSCVKGTCNSPVAPWNCI
ncbi:unnamed protein product (macronuclear) [Paramecium tetraurelia]|uniref:Granulins domain-containing protein n=1 Tax=Paramecium tetraurelia TaxID=5888 RepID=A0CSP5_PARTE|nr:uncharacterized protein GSPATT00010084001 [Paramecium tetraurelia]CAK73812.1 unnamed protein product [Paramecium tetraurelia]|eukprot:XP_001441209.1 hypothetical protein (macronuclear) [Paramecium tetraurelia strain d4-2]